MSEKPLSINITSSAIIKTIFILVIVFFLYYIRNIVMAVFFSVVIASGLEPAAAWFKRKRIPRVLGVIFVYLAIFAFLGAMFYLIVPTIFNELTRFSSQLPQYLNKPFRFGKLEEIFPTLPSFASDALTNVVAQAADYFKNFANGIFGIISAAFGGAVSLVLIIVLSFYLSVQENGIEKFLRVVIPSKHEEYSINLWMRWRKKIGYWLQGQILLGFIVGVLVYMGLTLLRIDYALTFAILAAIFELIPIFGPILSAIPPVAIALLQKPLLGLEVGILYLVIQQFENHLIYPLVVRKIVGIPAVVVILALVIGAKMGGFLGMLLAVPLATVLMEVLEDIDYRKKHAIKEAAFSESNE